MKNDTEKIFPIVGKRIPEMVQTINQLKLALSRDFGLDHREQLIELNIHGWDELMISPARAYEQVAAAREVL